MKQQLNATGAPPVSNRRQCAWAILLVMALGLISLRAEGQAAGTGTAAAAPAPAAPPAPVALSPGAYASPNTAIPEINQFVSLNVANLVDGDAPAQAKAREVLVQGTMTAGAPAAPTFLYEYGRALNNELSARLDPKKAAALRQKLNIAIVAARVAEVAQNTTLVDTTVKLINDTAEPVVLWGMKAAKSQVPQAMKVKLGSALPPLVAAIAPAVIRHPTGAIFDEGYHALSGSADDAVIAELIKLWDNRLTQYKSSTPGNPKSIPDDPAVDAHPVFVLTQQSMWTTLIKTPQQRTQVMQMVADQMFMAAQLADAGTAGPDHDQLLKLATQCGAGCYVVGGHQNLPNLVAAATKLAQLNVLNAGQVKIMPMVSPALVNELITAFKINPPPVLGAGNAAPGGGVARP